MSTKKGTEEICLKSTVNKKRNGRKDGMRSKQRSRKPKRVRVTNDTTKNAKRSKRKHPKGRCYIPLLDSDKPYFVERRRQLEAEQLAVDFDAAISELLADEAADEEITLYFVMNNTPS